jgi:hypothetical protein
VAIEPGPATHRKHKFLHREMARIRRVTIDVSLERHHQGATNRQGNPLKRIDRDAPDSPFDARHHHATDPGEIGQLLLGPVTLEASLPDL